MPRMRLRIASRNSPLAMWQAEFVKSRLERAHSGLGVEIVGFTTTGDRLLHSPLARLGGKGLFVKELERAMLDGEADIAVHSMKDVPAGLPAGLGLAVICERADPSDAFVSNRYQSVAELPTGARVGTSSLRRQCQLRLLRPDLELADLRGNVGTRLGKLDDGQYDAIILASAGLMRLELEARIRSRLAVDDCLPAAGQGAVGVECRNDDEQTLRLLACLHHEDTAARVAAERAVTTTLQGGCELPIAAHAILRGGELHLRALVADTASSEILRAEGSGPVAEAESTGRAVAASLLARGADRIIAGPRDTSQS